MRVKPVKCVYSDQCMGNGRDHGGLLAWLVAWVGGLLGVMEGWQWPAWVRSLVISVGYSETSKGRMQS